MTRDADPRRRWDIVSLGEAMIEFNAVPPTGHYVLGYGGDTSNGVVAAARLGARCAYVTRVGDDELGAALRAMWRREGVSCDAVRTVPGAPTGLYFVHHDDAGHHFTYRRAGSAASGIEPGDVPPTLIGDTAWLHVSGITLALSDSARAAAHEALRLAAAAGVATCFDLNHRPALASAETAFAQARDVLASGPLFLVAVEEARSVTGWREPGDIARWALDQGARAVVVKLGAQGCVVGERERLVACPGWPVDAVDATGAGDCFAGACLARLVAGDDLVAAARYANVAAALSTRGRGAVDPLPRTIDVTRALADPLGAGRSR